MPVFSDIYLMAMIAGRQISDAVNDPNYNGFILIEFLARRVPFGNDQASYDLLLEVAEHASVTRADLATAFHTAAGRDFEPHGIARITYATWAALMRDPETSDKQDPTQYTFELTFCEAGETQIWGFPTREAAEDTIKTLLERAKGGGIKVACSSVSRMPNL